MRCFKNPFPRLSASSSSSLSSFFSFFLEELPFGSSTSRLRYGKLWQNFHLLLMIESEKMCCLSFSSSSCSSSSSSSPSSFSFHLSSLFGFSSLFSSSRTSWLFRSLLMLFILVISFLYHQSLYILFCAAQQERSPPSSVGIGKSIMYMPEEPAAIAPSSIYSPAPKVESSSSSYASNSVHHKHYENRRMEEIILPPRKVCERGWYDRTADACVFFDRSDRIMPTFDCPKGSVLDGDHCYGKILSDFELDCPKNFDVNKKHLCIKAIVYSPVRVNCPEVCPYSENGDGFKVKNYGGSRIKQCARTKYMVPVMRPIETELSAVPLGCQHDNRYCPVPLKPVADKNWIFECPEGKLVKLKDTKKTVCLVKIIVPPKARETCKKGYTWTVLSAGAACLKLTILDAVKVCPEPNAKLGPGFGDWDTPQYRYHPDHNCVAYKARALGGKCPFGFVLEKNVCYRKIYLPYYMDCNNVEGYGFHWNAKTQTGECRFQFDRFKWSASASYPTKREKLQSSRIQLLSNPSEAHDAFRKGQIFKEESLEAEAEGAAERI